MTESTVFKWVSEQLERRTDLKRIEARGTMRIVLRKAGLEPAGIDCEQMKVVLQQLLPDALRRRRVTDPEALCSQMAEGLEGWTEDGDTSREETAYDVFRRLGGD